jgi:hypothetical protein
MADQLIIFQKLYDLFVYTHNVVAKFPKSQRFLLANHLLQANIEMIKLTIIANSKPDRLAEQKEISLQLDLFRIYVRLAKDVHFLALPQYEYLMVLVNEIGRLLSGWMKTGRE